MYGYIVKLVTIPGLVVDAFVNKTMCERLDLHVESVDYVALTNEALVHEIPNTYNKMFALAVVPFIIQSAMAVALFQIGVMLGEPTEYVFAYFGISIAAHSFPSILMGGLLWEHSKQALKETKYMVLLGLPFVLIIFIARILHMFWLDIIYGLILYFWIKGDHFF